MNGIPNLYNQNKSIFFDFINNSNQKDIIALKIVNEIKKKKLKKLVITDIGAGEGTIASKIISQIQNNLDFIYNFIDPSIELINEFKKDVNSRRVTFFCDSIQNIELPKSDIIILSFVFQTIGYDSNLIREVYNSLNIGGTIIIVNQNIDNIDNKIRNILGNTQNDITLNLISKLNLLNINFTLETVNSEFNGVDDIINLTEIGKNCLSFLLFKNFELITDKELEEVVNFIKKNTINGKLYRKEDYIFIKK